MNDDNELLRRLEVHEAQLGLLDAQRSITDTLYQYCHALDYGDETAWLDCFAENASWFWTVRDHVIQHAVQSQGLGTVPIGTMRNRTGSVGPPPDGALVGRPALARMVAAHSHAPDRWHKHCVSNTRIHLDGEAAYVDSYFVRVDGYKESSGAYIRAFGRYLDDFVHDSDGKWRIQHRRCEVEAHFDESMLEQLQP